MAEVLNESENVDTTVEGKIELDDAISTDISIEELENLNESQSIVLAQLVSSKLERYEDLIMMVETLGISMDEAIDRGYDEDEFNRLRKLEKNIHSHIRRLKKVKKNVGFFANFPVWSIVLFIVVFLGTFFPINPLLPVTLVTKIVITIRTYNPTFGIDNPDLTIGILYMVYSLIFFLPEIIMSIIMFVKARKNKEKMSAFKCTLIVFITNFIIYIPGLIALIRTYYK